MALHDEYDIQVGAGSVSRRHALNLIQGTGMTISVTDNSANDRSDVTLAATGSTSFARMPHNTIGGWVGSTMDPAATAGSPEVNEVSGVIYAAAFVADSATSYSNLGLVRSATQMVGSGSIFTITDASGNNLATATNSDTILTGASSGYLQMTLNATLTPTAGGLYYVVFLFPSTVTTLPTFYASGANGGAANAGGAVRFRSYTTTGQSTIPNPITINTTNFPAVPSGMPFFGVK